MDTPEDIPLELLPHPETRLVQTHITLRPKSTSALVSLFMILFITLITQIYWRNSFHLADQLPAVNRLIFDNGEVWRLFSAILIHGDMGHLLANMYMLGILSYFVYGYFGWGLYPVTTFFGAALVNLISISTYPPDVRLLGASGWVYLLGGLWLTLYLLIQRQYRFSRRLLRVCGIALMIFFPTTFEPTTSYRTHFIGFIIGILIALIYFYFQRRQIRQSEAYRVFD
jgi:rhomboid protease GluP